MEIEAFEMNLRRFSKCVCGAGVWVLAFHRHRVVFTCRKCGYFVELPYAKAHEVFCRIVSRPGLSDAATVANAKRILEAYPRCSELS